MSDLYKDTAYLRATLREMATRLAYPGALSAIEIVQNGRIAEAVLLLLDRVDALEGKEVAPTPEPTPRFQERTFIVEYAGEELCRPEHRQRAEAEGYEVIGTFTFEPGKTYLKLGMR